MYNVEVSLIVWSGSPSGTVDCRVNESPRHLASARVGVNGFNTSCYLQAILQRFPLPGST